MCQAHKHQNRFLEVEKKNDIFIIEYVTCESPLFSGEKNLYYTTCLNLQQLGFSVKDKNIKIGFWFRHQFIMILMLLFKKEWRMDSDSQVILITRTNKLYYLC